MAKIPEKFIRALRVIDIQPSENILEIGCGTGLLAALIAEKLTTGKITALDKSKSMMMKTEQRLGHYIDAGRAMVFRKDFADFHPKEKFDKVIAFSVNFFWKKSEIEFELLKKLMDEQSSLYVFYDAPGKIKPSLIEAMKENLIQASFKISEVIDLKKDGSVCYIKAGLS